MITISTAELKKFFSRATPIKDSNFLPIYAYVKLICEGDTATMIKHNGHSFVVAQVKATFKKNITMLLEQKTLASSVTYAKNKEITIIKEAKRTRLVNGFPGDSFFINEDPALYPEIEEKGKEQSFTFTKDLIEALYFSKNHALLPMDKGIRPWTTYVHIYKLAGENIKKKDEKFYVLGMNNVISYFKSFKANLPLVSFDPEVVPAIKGFDQVEYSTAGKYDYFDAGDVAYGFIQNHGQCADISTILKKFVHDNKFIVSRQDVVTFCEYVISMHTSSIEPEIVIQDGGKEEVEFRYISAAADKGNHILLPVEEKNFKPERFVVKAKDMITLLKEQTFEKVQFSHIPYHYIITTKDDKDYIGGIMQIVEQPVG